MKNIISIYKKELKGYFSSPIAYVYVVTFLVVTNWLFFKGFFIVAQADMRSFFSVMPWIYLFFVPAVSMGKWSEELKLGTHELLLTLPVKSIDIVIGKFLSALSLIVIALLLTFTVPATILFFGDLDIGAVIGGYLGLIFLGAAYLAVGLLISSLTENQIVAFILSVVASFILLIFGEPIFTINLPNFLVGIFQYIGLGNHFVSIGRGVIDSRDIIYYLSFIGFFLWLNYLSVSFHFKKRGKRKDVLFLVAGVLIIIATANFLGSRHFARLDITEDREYTLSDSTKKILKNLDDVVDVDLYFSRDLPPAVTPIEQRINDTLNEFKQYAGNKLQLKYIDPQESQKSEMETQIMGIPPIQVNVIQKDKQELVKVYLGMVVIHGDRKEVVPVVQNSANLEYQMVSAIIKVSSSSTPKLGWFSKGGGSYSGIREALSARYEIQDVNLAGLDPASEALLVLTLNEDLSEKEIKYLDGFLMNGGKAILMANRIEIGANLQSSKIPMDKLSAWLEISGLKIDDGLLLDHSNTYAAFSGGYVTYHITYPYWVKIIARGFDKESPIVSELDSLILPWVSPVSVNEVNNYKTEVLAKSSEFNKLVSIDTSLMPEEAQKILGASKAETRNLVVMVSRVDTSSQMIVIGCSRFIEDKFLRQFSENALFFENAVDYMAMGNDLIGIRSKGKSDRPIEPISNAGIILVKYLNLLGMPILFVAYGLIVFALRKQKRKMYKRVHGI